MFYLCLFSLWWIVLSASPAGRFEPRAATETPAHRWTGVAHRIRRRMMRGRATFCQLAARRALGAVTGATGIAGTSPAAGCKSRRIPLRLTRRARGCAACRVYPGVGDDVGVGVSP